jgi:putative N6-adenine-specific DNA methylase
MGSGTILIEAAALARRLAPGRMRSFAVEHLALHDPELLAAVRRAATGANLPALPFRIFGSDRSAAALASTRGNAERAGVSEDLELRTARLGAALDGLPAMPDSGALVTNPPFGRRMGDLNRLADLYRSLGGLARQLPTGWLTALVAADRRMALRSGLDLHTAFLTDAGGLKIRGLTTGRTAPRSFSP